MAKRRAHGEGSIRQRKDGRWEARVTQSVRFHDLRHSCAGYLLSEGVPLKTVSDILGHSQISITADYYGHISPRAQREALEKVRGFVE